MGPGGLPATPMPLREKALGREPAAAAHADDVGHPCGGPIGNGDVATLRVHEALPSLSEGLSKVASEVGTRKCG